MGTNSAIPWCDHTWNPWQGCHHSGSPGCDRCYMFREKRRYNQQPDRVVRSKPPTFNMPLRKVKRYEKQKDLPADQRRGDPGWAPGDRVFVCSWSDFFIEEADPWRAEAMDIIRQCPELIFMLLTKRPERIKETLGGTICPQNVWLGVTVENQEMAEKRIPILLDVGRFLQGFLFVSIEPMLGPVNLDPWLKRVDVCSGGCEAENVPQDEDRCPECGREGTIISVWGDEQLDHIRTGERYSEAKYAGEDGPPIHWIIVGGESGPGARQMDLDWARTIRDQCALADVSYFFKQVSAVRPQRFMIPTDLRIQEVPQCE